jgi:hypothetical protein
MLPHRQWMELLGRPLQAKASFAAWVWVKM